MVQDMLNIHLGWDHCKKGKYYYMVSMEAYSD